MSLGLVSAGLEFGASIIGTVPQGKLRNHCEHYPTPHATTRPPLPSESIAIQTFPAGSSRQNISGITHDIQSGGASSIVSTRQPSLARLDLYAAVLSHRPSLFHTSSSEARPLASTT